MKRIATLLMALVLCLGLTIPAMAAPSYTYSPYTWEADGWWGDTEITIDKVYNDGGIYHVPVGAVVTLTPKNDTQYAGLWTHAYVNDVYQQKAQILSPSGTFENCGSAFNSLELDYSDYTRTAIPGYTLTQGKTYTFTITQELADWTVDSKLDICASEVVPDYGVIMSKAYVTIDQVAAEPETPAQPANPFTDVANDAYYHDAVLWALENKITTGVTATEFQPTATCTRGQVATFLWRAKGCPEPQTTVNPFTDVAASSPFYKAILWAYENGITSGTTATTFNPSGTCSSAHVVTFLWRAEGKPAASGDSALAAANPGAYYTDAVAWADSSDLLSGTGSAFAPNAKSPRADIVTYLYRNLAQ